VWDVLVGEQGIVEVVGEKNQIFGRCIEKVRKYLVRMER
jgi:hypothetical protein